MKIVPNFTGVALVCFMTICSMSAAGEQKDDLLSVVNETLRTNPEIQVRLEAFLASTHDEREALGGYFPVVDLNLSSGRADREFDSRGLYDRELAEFSLTQMLFDGFRVRSAVARAKHASQGRYYELLDEAETKALEASEAYLSVLRHRELVSLAQNNVANHRRVQRHVSERTNRGVSNRADLKQIDGRVSLARSNLLTEIANLQSVTARFQRLVGRLPAEELSSYDIADGIVPNDLSQVLADVYANNPALFAAFEQIQASEASYKEVKSGRYPTVEFGARTGFYKNNNSFDSRTDQDSFGAESAVELRLRYNLYRGGSERAAERAANNRIGQAESLRDKTCVDLRQVATISHGDVLNLQLKMSSLANHRDDALGVLEAYREQFDIGRRSLLDVLDSENEFFQSERAYVNGSYDLQINRLKTLHSMGKLLETFSIASESFPDLGDIDNTVTPGLGRYCTLPQNADFRFERYLDSIASEEVLNLSNDTLFDIGSAKLNPSATPHLQDFTRKLLERGTVQTISVIGHTDSSGSDEVNRELSLSRAIAVRDALIDNGINEAVIMVSGVGALHPIANNESAVGRSANRRVEVRVVHGRK
ncbi:MAG: TolC family outer membrane protein [Gammaproteobacteria bacterium]|nr:TolC family outer membrane protein [Gammaproteobacteria bacterium]MBU1833359.1 TolC family outer membrane protein [Gammaproteobacteria bacterium]